MVRVILTGGLEAKEMVELVLHDSKFALVTSATSCEPFMKLNTRMSPTKKVLFAAQVW